MLSPAKMGVQILYNANKKVESIVNLTTAEKIDKNGVSIGEKVAETILSLTYEGDTTIISDINNGSKGSKLFGTDGKLYHELIKQNDKYINFTVYDDVKVTDTGKRCAFVMTNDDIA